MLFSDQARENVQATADNRWSALIYESAFKSTAQEYSSLAMLQSCTTVLYLLKMNTSHCLLLDHDHERVHANGDHR